MAWSQNNARNQLAKRCRVLLDKEIIENKFFFGMPDIGDVGEKSLQYLGIEVNFYLIVAGHILCRSHAAQKRQAYCLTTTKKKHDSAMTSAIKHLLLASALMGVLGFTGCIDQYGERDNTASAYRTPASTSQEQFVGSIYFGTTSSTLSKAALHDLAHMASRIQERTHAGSRVILVGYSDRKRGVEENSELAAERAQRVAIALEKKGVALERIIIDSRAVRLTKPQNAERRVDIFLEGGRAMRGNAYYPVLVGLFLLTAAVVAVIVFRRKR